jgi:MFS family permease
MTGTPTTSGSDDLAHPGGRLGWVTPSLRAALVASVGSGIAGFSVTALVGDVATTFGAPGAGEGVVAQIGLTGTTLGVSLALIRLASLGALPGAALADRLGRRRMLLVMLGVGLALTMTGAFAPGYWWWVAVVALARPFLSTVNAVASVVAAEETSVRYRAWALAGIGAAYGIGSGVVPVLRGLVPGISFRVVLGLVVVPLLVLPVLSRWLRDPDVYQQAPEPDRPAVPGAVPPQHRRHLALLLLATASLALATGPGFTFVVVYGEEVLGATSTTTALLVVSAGPIGLVGLLLGRWLSDSLGRRPTIALAMLGTAVALAITYSGVQEGLVVGYLVAIMSASAFGVPAAALAAEAFPTRVRATVAGWVTAAGVSGAVIGLASFGVLADVTGTFAEAARILAVVVVVGVLAVIGLPETRGAELTQFD